MKDFTEDKPEKDTSEEASGFSDWDSENYPEVEEEYSEEDTPTEMDSSLQTLASLKRQKWSRWSVIVVAFLCVGFGVLLLAVISFMKPEVQRPQFVGRRIRVPIMSVEKEEGPRIPRIVDEEGMEEKPLEGGILEEEKPILSKPLEPSIVIQEREVGKKVFILGEKEPPKEEKEVKVAEVEGERREIEGKEEGKPQVAMVEKPKGHAIPEGKFPTGRYTVNVGSFRKRVRAERLMKELEDKGYEAFVEKANIPGKGIWYRVAVGRFPSRVEALAFARGLKEKGFNYYFVRRIKEVKQ